MATSKIQTGLRIDESMHEKLCLISERECRSLNNLIEYALQVFLEGYEAKNGPVTPKPDAHKP